jgi:Protein kinase domain
MYTAPLHLPCPECGADNPPHARFCGACGKGLSTQNTGILPAHTDTAPEQYRSTTSVQPAQPAPTRLLSQTSITSPEQSVTQQPVVIPESPPLTQPVLVTRQLSAQMPIGVFPNTSGTSPRIGTRQHPYGTDPELVPTTSPSPVQSPLLKQRYKLIKQVGIGGYGIVYKALDTEFGGRLVAIKEMSQTEMSGKARAEATEAFKREAFMLASLTHPNLPSIYDYFTENGRWYLVMSYIEGETLEAYLNRSSGGKLPVEKVLLIGSQLASVLSYLHKRNPPIIFRDLKPSNIMRIPEGQVYLIDFGIARHFKVGQPKDTIALGSPGYAAPEQYGRAQSTPQTDVYSLGATLYHMLTGIDPSDNPFNHPPLDLPNYPQLSILISCMLDMDPRKRPASMGNIKRELQRISSGRSHPPNIPSHGQPKPQSIPQTTSQIQRARGKFWQALLKSSLPEEQSIRHNHY